MINSKKFLISIAILVLLSFAGILTGSVHAFGSGMSPTPTGSLLFAFNGAYASYQTTVETARGTVSGLVNYTISGVNVMDQRLNVTMSFSNIFNQSVSSNVVSFYDLQPFPALNQMNLQSADQGQTSGDLGYGKVNTGVKVTVPAGTFTTDEVSIPNGAPVVDVNGVMWVEMSSGLIVKQAGSIRGYQNVVMELQSTNIPTGGPLQSSLSNTSGTSAQTDTGPSGVFTNIIEGFGNFLAGVSSLGGNLKFLDYAFSGQWSTTEIFAILILPVIAVVVSIGLRIRRGRRHLEVNSPPSQASIAAVSTQEMNSTLSQAPVATVSRHDVQGEAVDRSEVTMVGRSRAEVSMETLDKLDKVKSLLDSGAVTAEEFEVLKSSILGKSVTGSTANGGELKKPFKISDPPAPLVDRNEEKEPVKLTDLPIKQFDLPTPLVEGNDELKTFQVAPTATKQTEYVATTENDQLITLQEVLPVSRKAEYVIMKSIVGFYDKEKASGGTSSKGQLVLTNERLIYMRIPGRKILGMEVVMQAEDYSNKIEEGLRNEGSFEVPIANILEAVADRLGSFGTMARFYYMRVRYRSGSWDRAISFMLVPSSGKTVTEEFASEIKKLKVGEANTTV